MINYSKYHKATLGFSPTPLVELKQLRKVLGKSPRLFVKRDDLTGVALGGSKTRSLEYLLGDALAKKADLLITCGPVQSNHVRLTAAAGNILGLKVILVITGEKPQLPQGNMLLNHLLGANLIYSNLGLDELDSVINQVADQEREKGFRPYIINGGGYSALGSIGYIELIEELLEQADNLGIGIDYIILPTGTGCAQSGLILGSELFCPHIKIVGITINRPKDILVNRIKTEIEQTATLIGHVSKAKDEDVIIFDDYLGAGYGLPTAECLDAIKTVGRAESLILDPVYTGKAMAGLLSLINSGYFDQDETAVFLHTGGIPGLFDRADLFGD
jgi:L-cysteate sulfo-lyase